jgi:hypothetical protein
MRNPSKLLGKSKSLGLFHPKVEAPKLADLNLIPTEGPQVFKNMINSSVVQK